MSFFSKLSYLNALNQIAKFILLLEAKSMDEVLKDVKILTLHLIKYQSQLLKEL
jgi:hypothetical protein